MSAPKSLQIKIRASSEDKDVYQRAAEAAGMTLSDWMRTKLDAAVGDGDVASGETERASEGNSLQETLAEQPTEDGPAEWSDGSNGSIDAGDLREHSSEVVVGHDPEPIEAPAIETQEQPVSPAASAHILIFGGIADGGAFASALFEVSIDASRMLMQKLGDVAAIADARQEEINGLRAENRELAQRLRGVLAAIGGFSNGGIGNGADLVGSATHASVGGGYYVGNGARVRRGPRVRAPRAAPPPNPTEAGLASEPEEQEEVLGAFDADGMMAELAELGEPEPLLDPDEIPPERTWGPRMILWVTQRMWMNEEWGPRPGNAGCLVPDEILERHGYPPA